MKVEIIKNCRDGKRTRLKGQTLEVTPWKAEQLLKSKLVRELKKEVKVPIVKAETTQKIEVKETR